MPSAPITFVILQESVYELSTPAVAISPKNEITIFVYGLIVPFNHDPRAMCALLELDQLHLVCHLDSYLPFRR